MKVTVLVETAHDRQDMRSIFRRIRKALSQVSSYPCIAEFKNEAITVTLNNGTKIQMDSKLPRKHLSKPKGKSIIRNVRVA